MHSSQPNIIRLKVPEFLRIAAEAGLATDTEIGAHLRMNAASIWRLLHGKTAPGTPFIAAVLTSFPDVKFEDVFEAVTPPKCACAAGGVKELPPTRQATCDEAARNTGDTLAAGRHGRARAAYPHRHVA